MVEEANFWGPQVKVRAYKIAKNKYLSLGKVTAFLKEVVEISEKSSKKR